MKLVSDITIQINKDFNNDSDEAIKMLYTAIDKTDYLNTDRIIRCIVFLANGNLDELKKYIAAAIIDTRDVMLWAEYEPIGNDNFKRVRDFTNTFEACSINDDGA